MVTRNLWGLVLFAFVLACGPGQAGGSEEGDDDSMPADVLPDLPCGGADFQTDNQNCGACGNECFVHYEGTEWEAGSCVDGTCGPVWTSCSHYQEGQTCTDICEFYGWSCVPQGCAGYAGATIDSEWFGGQCSLVVQGPAETILGCNEPLIPFQDNEVERLVKCCCDGLQPQP